MKSYCPLRGHPGQVPQTSLLSMLMLVLVSVTPVWGQYSIETIARGGVPDHAPALSLPVEGAVAVGPAGKLYVTVQNAVYRMSNDGTMVRVAGGYSSIFGGDGGPATSAGFRPAGLALDAAGNLFIADPSIAVCAA